MASLNVTKKSKSRKPTKKKEKIENRFSFSLEKDSILNAQELVTGFLRNYKLPVPDSEFDWDWQTRRGNLTKRLRSFWEKKGLKCVKVNYFSYYDYDGTFFTDRVIANLGQALQTSLVPKGKYTFSIEKGPFNYGGYGHPGGSCWHTSKTQYEGSYAQYFEKIGGRIIKIFENENNRGVGRFWLLERKGIFIVFNGYFKGQGSYKMILPLSLALGLNLKKIGVTCDFLHINARTGFALGTKKQLEKIETFKISSRVPKEKGE